MDSGEIKKISDPKQVHDITQKLFCRKPVQIQDKTGNHPVRIKDYSNGKLQLIHNLNDATVRLLSLNHGEHRLFLECRIEKRDPDGTETAMPVRIHMRRQIRREKRVHISEGNAKVLWITDVITMKSIPDSMSGYNTRRDQIMQGFRDKLRKIFVISDIIYRKTFRMDNRMRVMSNFGKGIYVQNRNFPQVGINGKTIPFEEYRKIIQFDKLAESIIAEASVPLMYKNIYLFGYAMVHSTEDMDPSHYEKLEYFCRELVKEFHRSELFPRNPEHCIVTDMNYSGVGFMHPHNPAYIRGLMPGEHIMFDMHIPSGETMAFTGVIRNMKSFEKAHRIGVEFENLNQEQRTHLEKYFEHLKNHNAGSAGSG